MTNFFAMIIILGLANEQVLERNELKWCDIPSFVNTIATTIQGAKKVTFQPNLYVLSFTQDNADDMLSVGRDP